MTYLVTVATGVFSAPPRLSEGGNSAWFIPARTRLPGAAWHDFYEVECEKREAGIEKLSGLLHGKEMTGKHVHHAGRTGKHPDPEQQFEIRNRPSAGNAAAFEHPQQMGTISNHVSGGFRSFCVHARQQQYSSRLILIMNHRH